MFKLLLKQNPAPEPDVQQPFYSPVSQRAGTNNNSVSNHEAPANHETTDENDNENDGLIDEDSTTPQQQEPYMRATRTVSFNDCNIILISFLLYFHYQNITLYLCLYLI